MTGRNYPPDIVAEVQLNPLGLALYRLEHDRDVAVPEACQLVAAEWAELTLLRVVGRHEQPHIFECLDLTLEGSLQLAKMTDAIAPVEADWGSRYSINSFMRMMSFAVIPSPPPLSVQHPRVFSSRSIREMTSDDVERRFAVSARGWCRQASAKSGMENIELPSMEERRRAFEMRRSTE